MTPIDDGGLPEGMGVPASPSGYSAEPERWKTSRFARLLHDLAADGGDLSLRAERCIDDLADAIEGLCTQFGHQTSYNKSAAIWTGGLSDLERAFDLMGWHDPHRVPGATCDEPGCWKWIQAGIPTDDGYRRVCSQHARAIEARRAETAQTGSVVDESAVAPATCPDPTAQPQE